jgi:hypothetical protein
MVEYKFCDASYVGWDSQFITANDNCHHSEFFCVSCTNQIEFMVKNKLCDASS